jgi:polyhydroxybutyrate depolymerase
VKPRHLAWIGICAALSVFALQSCVRRGAARGPGVAMSVEGRPFRLYTPPALEGRAGPLVLVLHGGLSNADLFLSRFSLIEEAGSRGFRVAYLDGTLMGRPRANHRTWNAGDCCGSAAEQGVDDVGYLASVISSLTAQGLTGPGQVYLVGSSNGAMLSYRFACERRELVAGVVGLAGPLVRPTCQDARGVRVLHVHGMRDTTVPVGGGGAGDFLMGKSFRSVDETVAALRAGGASVEVILLQSGEHNAQTLDAAMRAERGVSLASIVGGFVRGP